MKIYKSGIALLSQFSKKVLKETDNISIAAERTSLRFSKNFVRKELPQISMRLNTDMMLNLTKYAKGMVFKPFAQNFLLSKQKLLSEMSRILPENELKLIEKARTPEELTKIMINFEWKNYVKNIQFERKLPRGKTFLDYEQIDYAARVERGKFVFAREKAMCTPSTNPEVVAIENILREQYNVKFVNLKDDLDIAKNVLKAFENAKKNNVSLPCNIVVSDFMFVNGEHFCTENLILLASKDSSNISRAINRKCMANLSVKDKQVLSMVGCMPNLSNCSTDAPEHAVLHEILHGTHPHLNAYSRRAIPHELRDIKEEVSLYSALSETHETYVELYTKRLIQGLDDREEQLFKYLDFWG